MPVVVCSKKLFTLIRVSAIVAQQSIIIKMLGFRCLNEVIKKNRSATIFIWSMPDFVAGEL